MTSDLTDAFIARVALANQRLVDPNEYTTSDLIDEFNTKNSINVARPISPTYTFSKHAPETFSSLYNSDTFISTKCSANKSRLFNKLDFEREVAAYSESRDTFCVIGQRYPSFVYFDNDVFAPNTIIDTLTKLRQNIGVRNSAACNFDINVLRVIPRFFKMDYRANAQNFDLSDFILHIIYLTEKGMSCVCYRDAILPKELDYIINRLTNAAATYPSAECYSLDFKLVAKINPKIITCPPIRGKDAHMRFRLLDWYMDNFHNLISASTLFTEYLSKIVLLFNIEQHSAYLLPPTLVVQFRAIPELEWYQVLARMLITAGMSRSVSANIKYLISLRDQLTYDTVHVVNEYDMYGFSPSLYMSADQSIILFDLDYCAVAIDHLLNIDNQISTAINDMSINYYISRFKNLLKFGRAMCHKQSEHFAQIESDLISYLSKSTFGYYVYTNYSI